MKRPIFEPIITQKEASERSSSTPISTFVPHQAMNLAELIRRFESGQRLNVHENFPAMSNFTRDKIYSESFEDAPGDDVHDIVDIQREIESHNDHKKDYQQRKKKAQADAAQRKQAEEAKPADNPPAD